MAYLGEDIGKLGFGLMRLPQTEDKKIDIELTKQLVDMFMSAGFTYFDTAWAYEGSEAAAKEALVDRYPRETYQLATKNAAWIKCKTREEAIGQFERSLELTGAGYFDYYLLHNLGGPRTKVFDDFDLWNYFQEKKKEGLIKHIGFSIHSTPEDLDGILSQHPEMEFVQLQINYADWDDPIIQAGASYEVARKHGKPVIIMEPVKGGNLSNPPDTVKEVFRKADPNVSFASWAMRYCADLDGVITILSGMNSMEQMRENIETIKGFTGLSDEQKQVLARAQEELAKVPTIPCTQCRYCEKVCPNNIGISGTFTSMNMMTRYNIIENAKNYMGMVVDGAGKKRATECVKCGACEDACPQHIHIIEELEKAAAVLCK